VLQSVMQSVLQSVLQCVYVQYIATLRVKSAVCLV